jgi:hypothetical protein
MHPPSAGRRCGARSRSNRQHPHRGVRSRTRRGDAARAASRGRRAPGARHACGRRAAASLAITDTWRWGMEAGERGKGAPEFSDGKWYWASAPAAPVSLRLSESVGAVGTRQEVAVYVEGTPPPYVLLSRPSGPVGHAAPGVGASGHAARLLRPGRRRRLHACRTRLCRPRGLPRDSRRRGGCGWARLALIASSSGGALLPPDELAREVDLSTRAIMRRGGQSRASTDCVDRSGGCGVGDPAIDGARLKSGPHTEAQRHREN